MQGKYMPSGELQGDTGMLPDRGCESGCMGDSHGVDLSVDATQPMGAITGATKSDAYCARHKSGEYDSMSHGNTPGDKFNGVIGGMGGEG